MSKWTPERKKHQAEKMKAHWAALTPQERAEWIQNSTNALRSDEGRKAISDGTKLGLAAPGVSEKISANMVRIWDGNTERREAAKELAKEILCDPVIVAQARAAHATPETSQAISEGNTESWASGRRSKSAVSEWATGLWNQRRAALAKLPELEAKLEAAKAKLAEVDRDRRPVDWDDRPEIWRVIYAILYSSPSTMNPELRALLGDKCPSDKTLQRIRSWANIRLGPWGKPTSTDN